MAVYVTGDTHGDWMSRLKTSSFPEQKELTNTHGQARGVAVEIL